jgi:hypothetical protein
MATEKDMTNAQVKVLGKFCTRCRQHKRSSGQLLPAGSGRTRWVCTACLAILAAHRAR